MKTSVNYDLVAPEYDRRYDANRFDGIESCLDWFLNGETRMVLEVGCGTGHWLASSAGLDRVVLGLDRSGGMLQHARATAPTAYLAQATADRLPLPDSSLDRVFCVNALHHFDAPDAFIAESRRVLRGAGGLLSIGLDPHAGSDQWWVYDYFPSALLLDRQRYLPASSIRDSFGAAGFRDVTTVIAQHIVAAIPFDQALDQGFVDRSATSQLMVISDDEYAAGRARLMAERPVLHADLRLYASVAWA